MKAHHLPRIITSARQLQLPARLVPPVEVSQLEKWCQWSGMLASKFLKCIVETRMSNRPGNTLEAVAVAADFEACGN